MGKVPINLFKPSKARGLSGLSTLYWNSQTQRHGDHLKIEGKGPGQMLAGFSYTLPKTNCLHLKKMGFGIRNLRIIVKNYPEMKGN